MQSSDKGNQWQDKTLNQVVQLKIVQIEREANTIPVGTHRYWSLCSWQKKELDQKKGTVHQPMMPTDSF